jgi:hypothetical protein
MMFFKTDEKINVIQFGTGDIGITAGLLDLPEETIGSVALTPKDPNEIGSEFNTGDECKLDTMIGCHTRLVFTDSRSIDVLIDRLEKCKVLMENEMLIPAPPEE